MFKTFPLLIVIVKKTVTIPAPIPATINIVVGLIPYQINPAILLAKNAATLCKLL